MLKITKVMGNWFFLKCGSHGLTLFRIFFIQKSISLNVKTFLFCKVFFKWMFFAKKLEAIEKVWSNKANTKQACIGLKQNC